MPGRRTDARHRTDVCDVLTVGGDHERYSRRERGGEPGRDEKMGIGDVRLEAACRASRAEEEVRVPTLSSTARVDDRALDLVPTRE